MSTILAIDPGPVDSAYALIDAATRQPIEIDKVANDLVLERLMDLCVGDPHPTEQFTLLEPSLGHIAVEMVASYGMAVGREVFETCVWIGRYRQVVDIYAQQIPCDLIVRRDVKMHHCHNAAAKDSNISQALIDRFASGVPNRGKGTKAQPGWFYGFAADIWQAYALAVLVADRLES